jgi:hypothetical protein
MYQAAPLLEQASARIVGVINFMPSYMGEPHLDGFTRKARAFGGRHRKMRQVGSLAPADQGAGSVCAGASGMPQRIAQTQRFMSSPAAVDVVRCDPRAEDSP